MQVPVLKRELRKRIRAKLAALSSEAVAEESRRVCEKVIESDVWKSAKSVALYSSMSAKGEFDTSTLVADALDNSKDNNKKNTPYLLAPVLAAQIVDEVPVDEHDVPVHEIVFD